MKEDKLVEQILVTFFEPLANTLNYHTINFHLTTKLQ